MNRGKDFITVKDLMNLMGTPHYQSAWRRHKSIRETIRPGKKGLTLKEYCDFEGYEMKEIRKLLE